MWIRPGQTRVLSSAFPNQVSCGADRPIAVEVSPGRPLGRPVHGHQTLAALARDVEHQNDRPLSTLWFPSQHSRHTIFLQLPRVSTMDPISQRRKGQDDVFSKLNEAIEDLNRAKELSSITQVKAVFGSTSGLLLAIRVSPLSIRVCGSTAG